MSPTRFTLHDGTSIPWLAWGNGTGQAKKDAIESGKVALDTGIRHIDTAQLYENEEQTGVAISQSGVSREEVYVTSKSEYVRSSRLLRKYCAPKQRSDFRPYPYALY